jgi:hypothetical protein
MINWRAVFETSIVRRLLIQVFWGYAWAFFGGYIIGWSKYSILGLIIGCTSYAFSGGSLMLAFINLRMIYRDFNFRRKSGIK